MGHVGPSRHLGCGCSSASLFAGMCPNVDGKQESFVIGQSVRFASSPQMRAYWGVAQASALSALGNFAGGRGSLRPSWPSAGWSGDVSFWSGLRR